MINMKKVEESKKDIEKILGVKMSMKEYFVLRLDWFEFYNNYDKYKDSVVVDMVKLWLEELRKDNK